MAEKTAAQIDETLSSCGSGENLTPRDITLCLNRYDSCIRSTSDLEKRRAYIKRFEMYKFKYDEENADDREKANLYLEDARNTVNRDSQRLECYQAAIKFTNNYKEKQKVRDEYNEYASTLTFQ